MFSVVSNGLKIFQFLRKHSENITKKTIMANDSLQSKGRFRIQLLLKDNAWNTRYIIPNNDRHCNSSTDWTLVGSVFNVESYEIKPTYVRIDTPHADMCNSNFIIKHSVYQIDHINYFEELFEPIPDYRKNCLFNVFNLIR